MPESPNATWEKYTELSVGEILRRARTQYGLTLDDVAGALRIRASQLGALEDGKPELLPGRVYAIGFVRAYAEYLALDGDKMVHLFKAQSVGGRTRPELALPVPASESRSPNVFALGGSLAALLAVFIVLGIFGAHHKNKPEEIPAVPGTLAADFATLVELPLTAATDNIGYTDAAPASEAAAPPPVPTRIVIQARDSAWLEIRDAQNRSILSRILKVGESYDVPDQPGLKLDTGNAGALQVFVDGKPAAPLGQTGDVKRAVPLDPDALKAAVPGAAATSPPAQPGSTPKPRKPRVRKPVQPDEANPDSAHAEDHYAPDHYSGDHYTPAHAPYYNQ